MRDSWYRLRSVAYDKEYRDWTDEIDRRLAVQGAEHWREFAAIVAGASVGISVAAAGTIATADQPLGAKFMMAIMLSASVCGFMLAYFSIQTGQLGVRSPLRASGVGAAFLIAAAQFSMTLWIRWMAVQDPMDTAAQFGTAARHWIGLAGVFALAASYASDNANRDLLDKEDNEPRSLAVFRSAQHRDRRNALATGLLACAAWGLSLAVPDQLVVWVVGVGVLAVGVSFGLGIRDQETTIRSLESARKDSRRPSNE